MHKYVYFILLLCQTTWAHPVSFKSSTGIMGSHNPEMSHVQVNHSFDYWFALGAHHYTRSKQTLEREANYLSTNFLVKRWNGAAFQANIYTILGAGESSLSGKSKDAHMLGLQFDVEDRKYYFLTRYQELRNNSQYELRQSVVRAGFAPYVGNFTDLHTWFILQWEKNDFYLEAGKENLTPLLRFFYRNVLFEIGHSLDGHTQFNYTIHF